MQLNIALEALAGTTPGTRTVRGSLTDGPLGLHRHILRQPVQHQPKGESGRGDAKRAFDAYLQTADITDLRAHRRLNIAEAESRGPYTLARIAAANRQIIDTYESNDCLSDRNVTEAELHAGIESGRYASLDQLGPIDGYRTQDDGDFEATHAVVSGLEARLVITQALWDDFAAHHAHGFPRGAMIGESFAVPGRGLARASEHRTMCLLARLRHEEVADMLRKSREPRAQALAALVPNVESLLSDPKTDSGLTSALGRFQSYVSETDGSQKGRDVYESLLAMAQPMIPDPKNKGSFLPNRDAPPAEQIALAFGGWHVLKAYHEEVVLEQLHYEAA